jgi:hypothetical protein
MVELYLAVKVREEDDHYVHFCLQLRPVPEETFWIDFIQDLTDHNVLGDEFVLMHLESMPLMQRLDPLITFVSAGEYRLCFEHRSF